MIFRYAFVAESGETDEAGRFSVRGGGVSNILSPGLPAYMPSLAIVVGISFEPVECDRPHPVRLVVECPDNAVGPFEYLATFRPVRNPIDPAMTVTLPMIMSFDNFPIPVRGEYKFRFFDRQVFLGETWFTVVVTNDQ